MLWHGDNISFSGREHRDNTVGKSEKAENAGRLKNLQ